MTKLGASLRRKDGFTLVETIVAFAIMALVVGVAVEIIGDGSLRQRFDQARMTALSHARSEIATLVGTGTVSPGVHAGAYPDGGAWRIEAVPLAAPIIAPVVTPEVEPLAEPAAQPAALPYAVTVEIYAPGQSDASVTLKTVVVAVARQ